MFDDNLLTIDRMEIKQGLTATEELDAKNKKPRSGFERGLP
jgi:hypothetical protein